MMRKSKMRELTFNEEYDFDEMRELTLNEVEEVNGGIGPLAYGAWVAGGAVAGFATGAFFGWTTTP